MKRTLNRLCAALLVLVCRPLYAGILVTDDLGNEVRLKQPAQRIVALAPHLVENTFAAGSGGKLVGAVAHSDYPPRALELPRVGNYNAPAVEAIVALQPDLVLAFASGNGGNAIRQLKNLGLTVYVSEPKQLPNIARTIRDLGKLGGTPDTAEQAARAFAQRLRELTARYSRQETITVFYQVWHKPLGTLNGEHVISDVIRLCGGANAFADEPALAPKLSIETVLHADPDVIVASGHGEARPDWLDDWKDWPSLRAVQNNHLYFLPPDLLQRHTPRILEGAAILCRQLEEARKGT